MRAPPLLLLVVILVSAGSLASSENAKAALSRIVVTLEEYNACDVGNSLQSCATVAKCYGRRLILDLQGCPDENRADLPSAETWIRGLLLPQSGAVVVMVEEDAVFTLSQYDDGGSTTVNEMAEYLEANMQAIQAWGNDSTIMSYDSNATDYATPSDNSSYTSSGQAMYEWNLDMIDAFNTWQKYSTSGEKYTVALLDSGISETVLPAFGGRIVDGYDFISDPDLAMDMDGRDAGYFDPGDGSETFCPGKPSSWHGSRVASVLAANFSGYLGASPGAYVMPVRVLGRCGSGYASDVADAIVWAAGGTINGLDRVAGENGDDGRQRVISMSFAGRGRCPSYMQSAVNLALSNNVTLFAAAGNDPTLLASEHFPANCRGVISVGALDFRMVMASYSSRGADIYMPGGDAVRPVPCLSYNMEQQGCIGTSIAVPQALLPVMLDVIHLDSIRSLSDPYDQQEPWDPSSSNPLLDAAALTLVDAPSTVAVYPPKALGVYLSSTDPPANPYTMTGQAYGNGVYTVSWGGTSHDTYPIIYAFVQGAPYAVWTDTSYSAGVFSLGTGLVAGYNGDWISLSMPDYVVLKNVVIVGRSDSNSGRAPLDYRIYGAGADNVWNQLIAVPSASYTSYTTTSPDSVSSVAYNKFAMVVYKLLSTSMSTLNFVSIRFNANIVSPCAAGTYKYSATQCALCSEGTYSSATGATSSSTCQNCPAGTYSGTQGATSSAACVSCSTGTYSAAGSSTCTNCPAGTYASSTGATACTPCPAGTYSTAVGASSSSTCNNACAAGTYSLAGSSTCTSCPAGGYSLGPVSSCTPTATQVPETVNKIFAAQGDAFVLLASNQVKGWGNNDVGQLGYGDTVNRGETVSSMGSNLGYLNFGTGLTVQDADFGGEHGCAIVGGGTKVRCWGKNSFGSQGMGFNPSYGTALYWIGDAPGEMGNALADVDLGTEFSTGQVTASKISCGNLYSCVLFSNGKAKCWGYDYMGALGQGIIMTRGDEPGEMGDNLAFLDVGVGKTISKISTGDAHACAILNDNTLKCWGYNWYGMVGIGTMDAVTSPTAVNVGGLTLKDIVCGQYHTCAILSDNTLKCWGYNSAGQLGQGHTNHLGDGAGEMGTSLLAINLGTGKTAKKVSMGYDYTCAILSDDTVKCWGQNNAGQLGYGDKVLRGDGPGEMGDALPTVDVGTGRYVVDIECYYASTCAKLDDGSIKCWGLASNGRLGRGVAPGAYGSSTYNVGDEAGEMGSALLVTDIGSATVMSVCPFVGGSANCTNCSAGFYSNVQGASSNATCANQCPAGTYSLAGASSCTPCPLGTYSSQLGASACASCPAGNSTASTGSLYASQCLPSYSRLSTRTVPTVALTGYSTTITGQSFGNGVYTIQCADTYSPICTNAFDRTTTAYWTLYSASGSHLYSGGVYMGTYDLATDGYKGHWATISFPFEMTPQSIKVTGYSTSTFWPKVYRFYGKKVGSSSWEILRDETNAAYTGSDHVGAVTSSPVALYDTFGFEVKQLMGSATGGYVAELGITGIVSEGCPAGMYAIDSTLCIACPAGTSSSAGATSIASCIPCSAGSYATSVGTPSCTLCPAGTFSTATGANSSSVCQSCPAGTYSATVGGTNSSACVGCPLNTYSTAVGASNVSACLSCPMGYITASVGGTLCVEKPPTQSLTMRVSTDRLFPPTLPADNFGAPDCSTSTTVSGQAYGNGAYSWQWSTSYDNTCTYNPGRIWRAPDLTPWGCGIWYTQVVQYSSIGPYTGSLYLAETTYKGEWIWLKLPAAYTLSKIRLNADSNNFNYRPIDYRIYGKNGAGAWTQVMDVTNAEYTSNTHESPISSSTSSYDTFGFAVNKVAPSSNGLVICRLWFIAKDLSACAAGTYALNTTYCMECPAGTYNSVVDNTASSCTLCPAGTASKYTGMATSAACASCAAGWYADTAGSTNCTQCPAGRYSSSLGTTNCTLCSGGTYSAVVGATSSATCQTCPAGTFSTNGSTSCTTCPAGTFSAAGAASCTPCPAGTYAPSPGQAGSCTACPLGSYATTTTCTPCPAGTFTTMSGASSVQACYSACGAGNYSAAGSTSCSMCPAGSYSSPAGTSCPSPTDPVTVQNTLSCGTSHTCAVISNGSVLCWGGGTSGQLGNGQVPGSQLTPVAATGITNAVQVDAGNSHTCAVLKTGAIMCWGDSASGKLGNGASSGIYSSPVQVTGITKGVAVCTSMSSTCALLSDRTVACWGNALNGVLGNNDITNTIYATPVAVLNLQDAVQIAGADAHYCAMRATGGVVCWGTAGNGRLGNGVTSGSYGTPVTVTGLTNAIYIDSAGSHTCAVRSDRSVACWGSGGDYRLGYSLTLVTDMSTPATVLSVQNIATVFLGNLHSCVVTTSGALSCWGNNGNGQVGIGNYNTPINTPRTVLNIDAGTGVAFASGVFHSCVSLKNSSIICWGNGGSGRLGNGLTATQNTPVIATSVGSQQVPSPTPTCTVVPGPSSCSTCEAGKYSATAGQGVCTACAAGTYSTSANSTSCTPCGAGTYLPTTGSNSSGACLPCPAGTYSAGPGASNCTPCATGTYNPNSSATSCISCPVNTYATSTGASSVQQCVASVPFPTVWVSRVMPPASLGCTADATTKTATLTGQAYGNGLYSVDWSSYYNGYNNFKCAFDKSYSQRGMTGQQCYGVDGFCSGSDLNSDGYQGAWVSITMPMSVRPTQIKLVQQYNAMMNTRNYRIYAKNTGMAKWDVLATVTDAVFISSDSSTNYTWSPSDNLPSYNSFAIEVNRIVAGYGAFYVEMALSEIIITGDEPTLGSCSAGTYSFASTTCILCPAGTASSAVGATSNSTCAACPTGSYSQAAGSSACVDCGAGTYSAQQGATSSAACQVCPAGTYSAARSAQCTSCPAGTYSSAGSTQCTTCATGKYSLANSANCTDCPAGTYGSSAGSGNCTACPAGYASSTTGATSNATCAMCTVGRYASAGSSSCAKCPYGTYANGNGTAACTSCPGNTSTPFVGSTYCKCSPASAPPATYRKYPPAGLQEYSWTLSNMGYGNGLYTILYSTKDARAGTRELKIAFDGNDGIYSGMAEEGAYWGAGGTYSSGSNSAIVPGYSGDWIALQMPDKVAYAYLRLYFSTVMNYRVYGRNSDNLAAGWTLLQEVIGAVYTSNVHLSPTISSSSKYDTLALAVGAVSSANQVQMQELTFYAAAAGSCLAGTFAVDDPTVSLCLACYPSTYSASSGGVGEGSCTQCPAGKYSGAYGASSCTSCPAGYWSTEVAAVDASTCQACGAGSASVPGSTSCTTCAPGYYATVGSATCTACPAGSYSTLNGASPSCTVCPAGTYSSQGSASCTPCAAGTASPSANQTSSAACATCPAGYYSTSGSPQCILCPIGSYSTAPSASQCTSCPAGTSTLLAGSTSSAPCLPVVSRYLDRRIPPAPGLPLSGSSTSATVTGLSFGNGVYTVATSSTYNTQNPIHAFDGTTTNYLTLGSTTNAADRYSYAIYNGALDFASDGFKGHWVSIVAPSGVSMLPYAVYIKGSVSIDYNPGVYRMYGRRVGSSTWEVLRNESASVTTYNGSAEHLGVISDPAPRAQYYDSFAIEVSQMQGVPSALDVQYGIIYDMYFVGYEVGNCSAGTYAVSNAQCLHCPAGTASSTVGATSNATCATCGTGTYSNGTGAPLCTPCAGGTASAATGASSPSTCQTCGAGTYAAPGSATCTQCPAGTYATSAGTSTCTPCGAGTYSTAVGATASSTCQSCPSGTYSTTVGATASSTCISCPAGTYASSFVVGGKSQNETCFPCGTGTYSTALGALGNATCTNCPIGKFSAVTGASALSMCLACPQGTYADATGTSQCKACPAGTYSTATSATSSSTCQACPAGSYSEPGSSTCTLCPYGTYSTSSGTAQCTQCPQGYNTDQPGATTPTLCNNIVARDPPGSACPAGTYAYSSTQCMGCPIGTYYGGTGAASSSACQSCPTGTYANVTGQSACTQCPAGTASSATKATSVATCAICPAGTYSGVAASSCTNCAAGTYATSAGTSTCTSCAAGTYSTAVGASLASTCQSCVAGTYSTTVGASSSATCQSCVAGTYSTVVGASSSATCQSCAAGTYSTVVGASSSSTCQSCAAGTYSTVVGASSSATCQSCIAGTYSTTVGASSNATCVACIAGTYSTTVGAVSASTCQSCVAGKYSSTVGASSSSTCQSCPAGSYSTVVGANTWLTCQSCVAGTYSGTVAAPSSDYCLQCTSGTYSTSVGATSSATCQPCDAGTYSTVYGAPSSATCTPCRTGTYSTVVGASSSSTCLECPAGTFSNVAGASTWSTCAACPDGSYASTAGSTACTQCVSGSATRLNR